MGLRPVLHILISSALRQDLKENEKWELVRPGILNETRSNESPCIKKFLVKSYQHFKVNLNAIEMVSTSRRATTFYIHHTTQHIKCGYPLHEVFIPVNVLITWTKSVQIQNYCITYKDEVSNLGFDN